MIKYIVLYNLRSAQNVGSIFRTADATAIEKIFLIGTTPSPIDRFGRAQKEVAKTALGAEKNVDWKHYHTVDELFKEEKLKIAVIEQTDKSVSIEKVKDIKTFDTVMFGNEVDGVPYKIIKSFPNVIEIPMKGSKESLNVSVCCGVVLYWFLLLK